MSAIHADLATAIEIARAGRDDEQARQCWQRALEHSPPAWRDEMRELMRAVASVQWQPWVTEAEHGKGLRRMLLGLVVLLEQRRGTSA